MSASQRATRIGKLHTALKKHYKPQPASSARPLLEHVLYASLLQDAPSELADEGMAKCEQEFFDWNEVRVTSVTELTQVLSRLPEPAKAASRIKSNLQAIFEEFYTFDLDHLKKENLGRAIAKFEKMPGMTPFVLSYTIQHGLGGHSIPVDYAAMVVMLATQIATQPEANSGKVPGLERAIPKNQGISFSNLLHQCAVALHKNAKDKTARAVLDAVDKGSAERFDQWLKSKKDAKKRVVKRKVQERADAEENARQAELEAAEAAAQKEAKKAAKKTTSKKSATTTEKKSVGEEKSPAAAKSAATKTPTKKKPETKVTPPKKPAKAAEKKAAPASKKAAPAKKAPVKKVTKASTKTAKKATKKAAKATTKKKVAPAKKKATKAATKKKTTKKTAAKSADNRKLTKRKPR